MMFSRPVIKYVYAHSGGVPYTVHGDTATCHTRHAAQGEPDTLSQERSAVRRVPLIDPPRDERHHRLRPVLLSPVSVRSF